MKQLIITLISVFCVFICYSQVSTPFLNNSYQSAQMPIYMPDFEQAQQIADIANRRVQAELDRKNNQEAHYEMFNSDYRMIVVWDDKLNDWHESSIDRSPVTFYLIDGPSGYSGIEYKDVKGNSDYFKILSVVKYETDEAHSLIWWRCYSKSMQRYCQLSINTNHIDKLRAIRLHLFDNNGDENTRYIYVIK